MNKKFLSILTGVSALAVAGLLSIIPASVSHAAPSQAPSQAPAATSGTVVRDTQITVYDERATNSPDPQYTNAHIEWSYSNVPNSNTFSHNTPRFIIRTNTEQVFEADASIRTTEYGSLYGATASVSFRFTYNGDIYEGTNLCVDINTYASGACANLDVIPSDRVDNFYKAPAPTVNPPVSGAPSEDPASKEFNAAIDNTVNEIGLAVQGLNADGSVNETRTVQYKSNYAISPKIIAALAKAENVTLIYTFEYEGIIFQSAITPETAAAMYSPTIAWYGPCYIATYSPTVPIGFVK